MRKSAGWIKRGFGIYECACACVIFARDDDDELENVKRAYLYSVLRWGRAKEFIKRARG